MDEKRIQEIKERLQATTPGAWKRWEPDEDYLGDESPSVETDDGEFICQTATEYGKVRTTAEADAVFIAHAKEDVTWLLEQLEVQFGKKQCAQNCLHVFRRGYSGPDERICQKCGKTVVDGNLCVDEISARAWLSWHPEMSADR